jgi:hypothetical protein
MVEDSFNRPLQVAANLREDFQRELASALYLRLRDALSTVHANDSPRLLVLDERLRYCRFDSERDSADLVFGNE